MPSRLKSLELQGYKTFAARTEFEFAESITAIVGPNGSGKSNIADALRWVLGEQSYSLLRGKKTEDMIFAGSEQRPRASMASASVVFDNSDNWLPIDFTEVAVARRAYRDGQNEYLLNGQKVRLKDVSELLADSGLAERTYTIIGQGLVDAALALKAEERRRLFEEAAGIGLHRSRREEALRRLETTQRNLERVQDILAEIKPRLRSLERQAKRAEEFEQVKSDLREVLKEWYGYHWHKAQRALRDARASARTQEISLQSARQAQENYHQKIRSLRTRMQALRSQSGEHHRRLSELHNRREHISRQIAVVDARIRSTFEQGERLQSDLARAQQEIGIQESRMKQAALEIARLEEEQEEAAEQMETAFGALRARRAERERAEAELLSTRQDLMRLKNQKSQIEMRISEKQAQRESLQSAYDQLDKSISESRQRIENLEQTAQETQERHKKAQQVRGERESSFKGLQEKISQFESKRREMAEDLSEQQTFLARVRARQEVLDQAEQALEGYASGARVLLQAARQEKLKGARATLSNILEVPVEIETAIVAALGEFLDSILVEGEADSDAALEILRNQSARGALLPLSSLKPLSPLRLNGKLSGDMLGIAAKLVKAPDELQTVVDLLLGQVVVVRDRRSARRVLKVLQDDSPSIAQKIRVVTMMGEVFHGSGQIVAGSEGKPSTLSRSRQKREIEQAIATAQIKAIDLENQLHEMDSGLAEMHAQAGLLEKEYKEALSEEEDKLLAHRRDLLSLEQAEREFHWQQERQGKIHKEIASGEQEISVMLPRVEELAADISRGEGDLKDKTSVLTELSLDEYQSRVSHWETRLAVARQALEDGASRFDERQSALESAKHTLETRRKRMEAIEEERAGLIREKDELSKAELENSQQIEAVRRLIEPLEERQVSAEREQDRLLNSEGEVQTELNQAEHRNAQAKINLARRQEALDSLRRRIEDDFGLVEFEYEADVSGPTPLPFQGLVERLPLVTRLSDEVEETLKRQRAHLRRMGPINPEAMKEYREVKERFQFLTEQVKDMEKAEVDIRKVIGELDALMEREFFHTFEKVADEFRQIFHRLFGGGSARLVLTDPDDLTNTGIDIEARLPGRREQGLSLLSGGERSLTATALVFALLRVSPTPFCVLDEVDAMLDEANVGRFRDLLRELSKSTQFIIITHNRNTVQVADAIYGVTMGRDTTSQVISLKLDQVSQVVA
jgi:chromosome segregation protein